MTRFAAALVVAVAVAVMAPTGVATARSEPVSASELCYASRHNDGYQILDEVDTTDGGADSTLDIQVIDVSFDCASLDLTMSFVTTHEWSNAMLDRLDVGITTVDPRDASVGCDGSEFMAVVESDASGLTGSLYFVPVGGTCKNRDDWVRLDTVRVARPTARSVSIELGLPSIGLPSPLYWVAALHDVDDRTTGGSDFVPDPFSGADRQHLTEHPPTGGRSTVSRWYVTNDLIGGIADYSFDFAEVYDRDPYVGDWDGDGRSGVGFRRGDVFFIRNSLTTGIAENVIGYGKPGDDVFVGDWDGDGLDTLAVRRGNVFFIRNSLTTGIAENVIGYGKPGDDVFVGDWDGDGLDTLAVRRGNVFFIRNSLTTGIADNVFGYGTADDMVLVGDWDGNGADTLAVRRGKEIFLRNDLESGPAAVVVSYGRATDEVLVGDWDGNGADTFVARRALVE